MMPIASRASGSNCFSGDSSGPKIENVFPDPVCPYAKIVP